MSLYYDDELNLKEIGAVLKVTRVARLPAARSGAGAVEGAAGGLARSRGNVGLSD